MAQPSIRKNLAYSTVYEILLIITPLITAPYVSRVLGADGVGIQSYTASIAYYFQLFAVWGRSSYGRREIAQHRDSKQEYSKLFWEIELMSVVTSCASLFLWAILIFLSADYRIYFIALTPNILGTMFDIVWFYNGLEKFKLTVMRDSFFKVFSIVLLFLFVKDENDVVIYIWILSLTTLISALSLWTYLPKVLVKVNFRELRIKRHFKQTFVYFIPKIATSIYTMLDKTLIGVITQDTSQNGYYEQAEKVINLAKNTSSTAVNSVMEPRNSYLFAEKKYDEIHHLIQESMNFILFMSVGCCFGIWGIAVNFVPVFFGEGYDPVVSLLYIFAPIVIAIGISSCLEAQYYTPSGHRAQTAKYTMCGAGINLVLNLIMIPRLGAIGAAIASLIAQSCIAVLDIANSQKFMTGKLLLQLAWKKLTAGAIMSVLVYFTGMVTFLPGLVTVILQVFVGILVYVVLLFVLHDAWVLEQAGKAFEKQKNRQKKEK